MPSSRATERWVTAGSRSTTPSTPRTISSSPASRFARLVSARAIYPTPPTPSGHVHSMNAVTLARSSRERQSRTRREIKLAVDNRGSGAGPAPSADLPVAAEKILIGGRKPSRSGFLRASRARADATRRAACAACRRADGIEGRAAPRIPPRRQPAAQSRRCVRSSPVPTLRKSRPSSASSRTRTHRPDHRRARNSRRGMPVPQTVTIGAPPILASWKRRISAAGTWLCSR